MRRWWHCVCLCLSLPTPDSMEGRVWPRWEQALAEGSAHTTQGQQAAGEGSSSARVGRHPGSLWTACLVLLGCKEHIHLSGPQFLCPRKGRRRLWQVGGCREATTRQLAGPGAECPSLDQMIPPRSHFSSPLVTHTTSREGQIPAVTSKIDYGDSHLSYLSSQHSKAALKSPRKGTVMWPLPLREDLGNTDTRASMKTLPISLTL